MKSLRQTGHHLQGPLSCLVVGMISEKQFLLNQYSTPVGSAISIQVTCKRLKTRSFTKILQTYSFLQIQCCHVSSYQVKSSFTLMVRQALWGSAITSGQSRDWCHDVMTSHVKVFFVAPLAIQGGRHLNKRQYTFLAVQDSSIGDLVTHSLTD